MGTATLETTPNIFHVFRNVKASEVNGQQRASNSHLSETTRIIQEGSASPSSSSSSFTIISRLFKPVDVATIPEWKSMAGISARKSQDGILAENFRSSDRYTIENGWIRYKSVDPPSAANLVLDSGPEAGGLEASSPASNSVVLDGVNIGHFVFRNTSQMAKLFDSGDRKPLVLVQNIFQRPNAQGTSI